MEWMYCVTTVPSRIGELLPRTLESLKAGGFPCPRLCVDGLEDPAPYRRFGLPITTRYPAVRTYANWALSLIEMYLRNPGAERFAVFQDDFVTYRNLRQYLEQSPTPPRSYGNCYTFPQNQSRCPRGLVGWYPSDQRGLGAVALVFTRDAVMTLLKQPHMVDRVHDQHRGWCAVDGGVVEAMRKAGWREMVHNPSLVQHTGVKSSMRHHRFPSALSFRGEAFDALELVCRASESRTQDTPQPEANGGLPEPLPPPPPPDRQQMVAFWDAWAEPVDQEQQSVLAVHAIDDMAGRKTLLVGQGVRTIREMGGWDLSAVDVSPIQVGRIRPLVKEAWLPDGLPSARFDLAVSHRVAQHTSDPDLIGDIGLILNSLKYDGVLSLQFASGSSGPATVAEQKAGKVYRTCEQMQSLVRDAGGFVERTVTSLPVSSNETWHVFRCRNEL